MSKKNKTEVEERMMGRHAQERMHQRIIPENLVKACLKKGRIKETRGARVYELSNIRVVVDSQDLYIITVYYKKAA